MRNGHVSIFLFLFSLLAIILVMGACELPWTWQGSMYVSIVTPQAKTLFPSLNPASYRISFSGPAIVSPIETSGTTTTISLAVGTWTVTVEGLDSTGRTIARGSRTNITVNAGTTTDAPISLAATGLSTGTIDVTVTWPAGIAVTSCRVMLGSTEKTSPAVTYAAQQVRYTETVASGYNQQLCFFLLDAGLRVLSTVEESIQVYDNLTTVAVIGLTSSDFDSAPAKPTGLAVTSGSNALLLSWDDNSHVETAYVLQRSIDNATWSDLASLSSNIETYIDSTATWGTTYFYRVGAVNTFGTTYSDSSSGSWTQTGSLLLIISVISPTDATITLSQNDDIIASPTSSIAVGITEAFDSYEWSLDGVTLSGQTANNLTLVCSSLDLGVHHLVVFVTRNGVLFSKALRFFVYN